MRLADPRDLPRALLVTPNATRSGPKAPRKQLQLPRRRRDPPARANHAGLDNRHLAEIKVDIQSDRSHHTLLSFGEHRENQWPNDTDGFALEAQPDQSQGPLSYRGITRPSPKNGIG